MSITHYCSFCGKSQREVRKLIAGPSLNLFICDECVDLCAYICAEPRQMIAADIGLSETEDFT